MSRLLFLCLAVLLPACTTVRPVEHVDHPLTKFEFVRLCMGVPTRIVLFADTEDAAAHAAADAFARIARLDEILSDYRPASDLNRFCDHGAASEMDIPPDLYANLALAAEVSAASDSAFDITVAPAIALWREARRAGRLPDAADITAARELINWRNVQLHPELPRAHLARPGVRIDLGGIGKGYAAERALRALREMGYPRSMVALAGDIAVGDPPPGQSGWRIAIVGERSHADHSARPAHTVLLANAAISTSGDAEQFVEIDNQRYSHIVDPATGIGMTAIRAVTVIAPTGEEADALATAACLRGPSKAHDLYARWARRPRSPSAHPPIAFLFDDSGSHTVIDPAGCLRFAPPADK